MEEIKDMGKEGDTFQSKIFWLRRLQRGYLARIEASLKKAEQLLMTDPDVATLLINDANAAHKEMWRQLHEKWYYKMANLNISNGF